MQKILNFVFFFKKVNTILEIAAKKSLFFFEFYFGNTVRGYVVYCVGRHT